MATLAELEAREIVVRAAIAALDNSVDFMEDGTQVNVSQMKLAHLKELDQIEKAKDALTVRSVRMGFTWMGKRYPDTPQVSEYAVDD